MVKMNSFPVHCQLIREFKQLRQLRRIKCHLKIKIFTMVTILQLLVFFLHSIKLTNYTKNGLVGARYNIIKYRNIFKDILLDV